MPFGLCVKYLSRQTVKPTQWIVVDDGEIPLHPDSFHVGVEQVDYVRRQRLPTDPSHTLLVNLLAALSVVHTGRIIFMEDDDWYAPTYLESMNQALDRGGDIVGQIHTVYYRIQRREWRNMCNQKHASLCATGLNASLFSLVRVGCEALGQDPFIDLYLWNHSRDKEQILIDPLPRLHVGIKEMPGRLGQTSGWKAGGPRYSSDEKFAQLRYLIGASDASAYERIANGQN